MSRICRLGKQLLRRDRFFREHIAFGIGGIVHYPVKASIRRCHRRGAGKDLRKVPSQAVFSAEDKHSDASCPGAGRDYRSSFAEAGFSQLFAGNSDKRRKQSSAAFQRQQTLCSRVCENDTAFRVGHHGWHFQAAHVIDGVYHFLCPPRVLNIPMRLPRRQFSAGS